MFTINYNEQKLTFHYNGGVYQFNLRDGDIGDYWNSFVHNGETLDINYHQEDMSQTPTLSVYHLDSDGYIDMSNSTEIEFAGYCGDPKNYF